MSNPESNTTVRNESDSISVVSVKLPPFWADQSDIWFAQAEAQFALRNITSSLTKYYHVTTTLPQEIATSVLDILRSPPTENPYETLKKRLVQTFNATDYQRAEQLTSLPGLGDRKPSQLMNSMLSLLPDNYTTGFLFDFLFLQRMPVEIRGHLVTRKFETPRDMAAKADEYWSIRQKMSHITSVNQTLVQPNENFEPINEVLAIRNSSTARQNTRPNRSVPNTDNTVCWYHRKWGTTAQSCRSPCSFQTPGNGLSGGSY